MIVVWSSFKTGRVSGGGWVLRVVEISLQFLRSLCHSVALGSSDNDILFCFCHCSIELHSQLPQLMLCTSWDVIKNWAKLQESDLHTDRPTSLGVLFKDLWYTLVPAAATTNTAEQQQQNNNNNNNQSSIEA